MVDKYACIYTDREIFRKLKFSHDRFIDLYHYAQTEYEVKILNLIKPQSSLLGKENSTRQLNRHCRHSEDDKHKLGV